MTMGTRSIVSIVWLRHDLRLKDNVLFHRACALAKRQQQNPNQPHYMLPVTVLPPHQYADGRCSVLRHRFTVECLTDLRHNLTTQHGSGLFVAVGRGATVIPALARAITRSLGADCSIQVHVTEEPASEERRDDVACERALKADGHALHRHWQLSMLHIDDLADKAAPPLINNQFTTWRKQVEENWVVRAPVEAPSQLPPLPPNMAAIAEQAVVAESETATAAPPPPMSHVPAPHEVGIDASLYVAAASDRAAMHDQGGFKGGETAALARLERWVFKEDKLKDYFSIRNGMVGSSYSSKLSPWLALGCISPRVIASECARYEQERVANKSTYWMIFELLVRDFFIFQAMKHGDAIFHVAGPSKDYAREWKGTGADLQRWKDGMTGWPLVDANMRELKATGFMSNRGRQNVASFLVYDIEVDWREGADHFECHLLDYDVSSNWGNWNQQAGLKGGRPNRFNTVKQTRDYDPKGDYIRRWIPELAAVPDKYIAEPWTMPPNVQRDCGVRIGADYPRNLKSRFSYAKPGDRGGNQGGGGGRGNGKGSARGKARNQRPPATNAAEASGGADAQHPESSRQRKRREQGLWFERDSGWKDPRPHAS